MIQGVMELINSGIYHSWELPADCHILLSENPDNGENNVNSLDEAQSTRFMTCNIKFNEKVWAKWAENLGTNGLDGRCINFLLLNPQAVTGTGVKEEGVKAKGINPRQWTKFFLSISNISNFESEIFKIQRLGEMGVGELATLFTSFITHKLDRLVSPQDMLFRKDKDALVKELRSNIGSDKDGTYNASIASTMGIRFMNYLLRHAQSEKVTKDQINRIGDLIKLELFGEDINVMVVKKIMDLSGGKFENLLADPAIVAYIVKD